MAEKPSASVSFAGRRFLVRRLRHKLSNKDDGKEAKNIIQQDYLCKNDTVPVLDCAPARAVRGTEPERRRWRMKRWRRVVQKQEQCKR